ncbi:hypothetical protein SAMN05421671_2026 [Pimelobacter simplex]|nr:hypothetical protein SAMN05421671_2026 [Pimelobacter simplex]
MPKVLSRADRARKVAVVTVLVLALSGCSGGDEKGAPSGPEPSGHATEQVPTDARLGKVRGRLGKAKADAVVAAVSAAVDTWVDGAYGGDYPRTDFGPAFAGFTRDARKLAQRQPGVMSNAAVGADLSAVEITERRVRVDVLGVDGRAAGATARVRIGLALSGGGERTEQVTGRLLLTPVKGGWQVFGFDVSRGKEGA